MLMKLNHEHKTNEEKLHSSLMLATNRMKELSFQKGRIYLHTSKVNVPPEESG